MSVAPRSRKSYGELRREAAARLRESKIDDAETDARVLLCHAAKIDAAKLISLDTQEADAEIALAFDGLIARRVSGEPVARILGEREFWSLRFMLGAETLVPRPETETIVEAVLSEIHDRSMPFDILDLGTGTGAILAALLSELPNARGVAVDRSEAALRIARGNFRNLSLAPRVSCLCGNWTDAFSGTFDWIVSNPPYIASREIALLSPEVRDHDPRLALEGGNDGLDAYRAIIRELPARLANGGKAVLELGQGQEAVVGALVSATASLKLPGPARKDLAGIPRALVIHVER